MTQGIRGLAADRRGQALIAATAVLFLMFAISLAVSGTGTAVFRAGNALAQSRVANAAASAGIEKAVWCMNNPGADSDCGGASGPSFSGESAAQVSGATYTSTVTSIDPVTKQVDVVAYAPDASNPVSTQHLRANATIETEHVSFNYALQAGIGGLIMNNNSTVTGNVYSNGDVIGTNGANVTGDVWIAGGTQPTADQASEIQTGDRQFGRDSTTVDPAQSFTPASSGALNSVTLYLKKVGTPSNKTVRIVTDSGGKPSKTSLASATLDTSLVTGSYGWISVPFSSTPDLVSGTKYWIVVDSSTDASDYLVWGEDSDANYLRGEGMYSPNWSAKSPTWTATGTDLDFRAWMGGVATELYGVNVQGSAHANTLSHCSVAGDAYYQTNDDCSIGGASYPGSADPGPAPFPVSDAQIAQWKQDAIAGGTYDGDYTVPDGGSQSLGPKEITGNLTLTNNASLTMTGTLYVHGDLYLSNNGVIRLDSSYGGNGGVIIVDGSITVSNNGQFNASGANSFFLVISTSSDMGVGAITLSNNVNGALFYAPNGKIVLANNTQVTGLTGKLVELENNAILVYDTGMADARFTSGPGGSWTVDKGTWREVK